MSSAADYYHGDAGRRYHERRESLRSEDVQRERAELFADVNTPAGVLLDFGCGTGGVAAALPAKRRIGVELNEYAVATAKTVLDEVVPELERVADSSVDTVISYHALEHVETPAAVLKELLRVLRPGGKIKIIVPCEMPVLNRAYARFLPNDPDFHIFSWTPQTLANLMVSQGFSIDGARLLPRSSGGRLGRMFKTTNWPRLLKSLRTGSFHTSVEGRRPA